MQAPVVTKEVALRIERAAAIASESRILHVHDLAGNPLGVEMRRWGHVTAVLVQRDLWYYPYFNGPANVMAGDSGAVDEAIAWYRGRGLRCRVSPCPFLADEALLRHLADRGLRPTGFMSLLFGVPEPGLLQPAEDVTVREARDPEDFLAVWLAGAPEADREALRPIVKAEFAEWRCYVAYVGGEPAGVAGLHVRGAVGTLAAGTTLPRFRGRGCQTELLRQRIADAYAAGCDLTISQAVPGSISQRNMERVGFRTAYTKITFVDQ